MVEHVVRPGGAPDTRRLLEMVHRVVRPVVGQVTERHADVQGFTERRTDGEIVERIEEDTEGDTGPQRHHEPIFVVRKSVMHPVEEKVESTSEWRVLRPVEDV